MLADVEMKALRLLAEISPTNNWNQWIEVNRILDDISRTEVHQLTLAQVHLFDRRVNLARLKFEFELEPTSNHALNTIRLEVDSLEQAIMEADEQRRTEEEVTRKRLIDDMCDRILGEIAALREQRTHLLEDLAAKIETRILRHKPYPYVLPDIQRIQSKVGFLTQRFRL